MTHYLSPPFWFADGDVRLCVPFNSNLSTDTSVYAHGAGTATNATISGNQFTQVTGATVQKIIWGPASTLGRSSQAWTLEAFYTWTSSDNSTDPGGDLEYLVGSFGYRLKLYANLGKIALNTPDFGDPDAVSVGNVLSGVGKVHVALVHPAGSTAQTLRCYVGGVQVFTYLELGGASNANGTVQIGNIQGVHNGVVAIDDVRLTMRELYTGSSFTPPTSPLCAVAAPSIVESIKQEVTTTGGTISITFAAAQAGDFLCVNGVNVTHSGTNPTGGWTGAGQQESSPSGVNATSWMFYKVAAGGETSFAATLSSGTGMKSAIFFNARGTDGTLYAHALNNDHTAGAGITAPVLSSVPAGALAFSVFAGGDDFPGSAAQFTCTVSGTGWTELNDACSNIPSSDQGGVTVATHTGSGTLAAGTGTFSRSVAGHIGRVFYLKS